MNHSFEHDGHITDILKSKVVHQNWQFLVWGCRSSKTAAQVTIFLAPGGHPPEPRSALSKFEPALKKIPKHQQEIVPHSWALSVTHSSLYWQVGYMEEWVMLSCVERLLVDVWGIVFFNAGLNLLNAILGSGGWPPGARKIVSWAAVFELLHQTKICRFCPSCFERVIHHFLD